MKLTRSTYLLNDSSDHNSELNELPTKKHISREELEKQIAQGDWAAVGATAAILASDNRASEGSLSSGLSVGGSSMSSSGLSTVFSGTSRERARAAELDRLVDAGDWEGVVLTAAKFEADDRDDKTYGSASIKDSNKSTADHSFANSSNNSTNMSDTMSNNLKRDEIRAEVEALVRRVVPDELDNVDEMMSQFIGREEELLETLRTMQERSIAARQREASRRNAKREAKRLAKESKKSALLAPPRPKTSRFPRTSEEMKSLTSSPDKSDLEDKMSSSASGHTSDRAALNSTSQGNWKQAGRPAHQIDDSSSANESASSLYGSPNSRGNPNNVYGSPNSRGKTNSAYGSPNSRGNSNSTTELTGLIKDENWSGVVAAASNYTSTKSKKNSNDSITSDDRSQRASISGAESDDGTDDPRRKHVIAKEEEEARAQAKIWSKIAEESKVKGSSAVGASNAADWAISRKFKEIQDSAAKKNQSDTQSVASSNDDTSV